MAYLYSFTTTVNAGTFTTKPEILEIIPSTNKQPNILNPEASFPVELQRYRRFQRVLLVRLDGRYIDERGDEDARYSPQTHDLYTVIIKTPTQADTYQIFSNLRTICVTNPFSATYHRVECPQPRYIMERGACIAVITVKAYTISGV